MILKILSVALVGTVLFILVKQTRSEFAALVSLAVCCLVFFCAFEFIDPIKDLIEKAESMTGLDSAILKPIWKAAGICVISEIAASLCNDCGNTSVEKAIRFSSAFYILWLSVPLLNELLGVLSSISGEI